MFQTIAAIDINHRLEMDIANTCVLLTAEHTDTHGYQTVLLLIWQFNRHICFKLPSVEVWKHILKWSAWKKFWLKSVFLFV